MKHGSGVTLVEVMPEGSLELLSRHEVNRLRSTGEGGQHEVLRRCALAVLNVGSQTDDTREVLEQYHDFEISIVQQDRGLKLAPGMRHRRPLSMAA